jgi:hypothetical protein
VAEKTPTDAPRNQERYRYDELDDMLSTVGSAMLGITLGCARCHDHKYDPIPQRDYYRMLAAFTTSARNETFLAPADVVAEYQARAAEFEQRLATAHAKLKEWLDREKAPLVKKRIEAFGLAEEDQALLAMPADDSNPRQQELLREYATRLEVPDEELREHLADPQKAAWDALATEMIEVEATRPPAPPSALTLTDHRPEPATSWLLERGEVDYKKEEVRLGFLRVLPGTEPGAIGAPPGAATTFQRRTLADWITDVEGGAGSLLARVIVNRLWQHHFGEGLVPTPNDFGSQGERPTHPELLDWLAAELVAQGWRLKPIHRLIMTSAVYGQDTTFDAARAGADPENRLCWRRQPFRLEAEALRDSILAVSGRLNPEMHGPGVKLPVPPELIITRTEGEHHYPKDVADGPAVWRRSVYSFIKRSVAFPMAELFDAPSPSASCGRRVPTIVAPQALVLMNDPFVRARSCDFAARLVREVGADPAAQVGRAWLLALGRSPTETERDASIRFLKEQRALTDFCQILFGLTV